MQLTTLALLVAADLTFLPQEGSLLEKTFESDLTLAVTEFGCRMGGEEIPPEYLPKLEIDIHRTRALRITDEYLNLRGGRAQRIRRLFTELEGHASEEVRLTPGEGSSTDHELTSDYAAESVVFELEDGEYVATLERSGESLPELREDLDLKALLPASEVDEGDTWSIDPTSLRGLRDPGGKLFREPDEDLPFDEGETTGDVRARLVEVEGDVARVLIEGEVFETESRAITLEHIPVVDGTAVEARETRTRIEAELLWDVAEHRARSLTFEGVLRVESVTTKDAGQPGPEFVNTLVMEGAWKLEVNATLVEG